ncbi:hypothetical protein I3842_07G178400 [Carya illinoinensis]|uniref:CUE domain-containing protein n=1 Tax=Carya illinoinensis TaxID=32201 RepID=A0A922EKF1_CARIL|nr:hypothetical protein I3842_07G178400 [Carya illinoinensis]
MASRYGNNRHAVNKESFARTQKKFVPKNHNSTPKEANPNSISTLSTSLRQSLSKQSDAATTSSGPPALTVSRVRMGENGDFVASTTPGGNFVNYLPQDEAVAAGLGADEGGLDPVESQRVVDLLNRELSRMLKLNARNFWTEVARDTSFLEFLDSFLQFRSRWYDFPHHGAKGIVAGVIVGELELSRRVFMVLYRISSNREPGARAADSLSTKDYRVILQDKKLLELPKLLDICAIYGHENKDLTRILVANVFKAQPRIHDNLTAVISHFLSIVHTMDQRCSLSLQVLLSTGSREDHGSGRLYSDYLEVMDFINDSIVSMDAFVTAYKPAAVYFSCPVELSSGNEELLKTLARLHDSLLPSLQRGLWIILQAEDAMISDVAISLKMLSMRIVKFGWNLVEICHLSNEVFDDSFPVPPAPKMFPANVEDPIIRADILVQTFREINGVSQKFQENENRETFLQSVEKVHNVMSRLESLRDTGWICMDDEQFQYLSGIMMHQPKATIKGPNYTKSPLASNKVQMDEDAVIMESKISQIKDLFPDFGKGFLVACLEVYNQNPEEVIQRILEGTLHEDLLSLDTSVDSIPMPKPALSVSSNDKGKGKLVEPASPKGKTKSTNPPSTTSVSVIGEQPLEGPSFSSSSSLGRYVRKPQGDLPDSNILDIRNEKDSAISGTIISQYEYEDEYDDSFDDLGLSVGETGMEETEMMGDKMSSNLGKSWGTESGSSVQNASGSKWGSRKKPQFYVRDGKNYSYKVAGSVAVANSGEAALLSQAQEELIYGLGQGGNIPLGAVKKLIESSEEQDERFDVSQSEGRGNVGNLRGRGRRGGGRPRESNEEENKQSDASEVEAKGNLGNQRGRGRRGGGGRSNHYRKDRAMNKHFSGVTGF